MTNIPSRAQPFTYHQPWRPVLTGLQSLLNKEITPSHARYIQLTNALWQGDPLMDAVVAWVFKSEPRQRKQLFEQALHQGVHTLDHCPTALQHFFAQVDTTPHWVDQQKIDHAVNFIHATGIHANYILRDLALMGGYLLSGFNQALVLTGALNKGASQRLAETSKWWIDCTSPNGLARFSNGFKSTIHVRFIHALVRRNLHRSEKWHAEDWGLPICQIDMAATNLAFSSLFLLGLRGLGVFPSTAESQAVMHFWKYLGWLMGVDERWLVDHELDGHILAYHSLFTQSPPDWTSQKLGAALSQEPLHKEFKSWQTLKRHVAYHKHLSVSRLFLGRKKMQQLGLPNHILPWFPLLITPKNMITFRIQRALPILRQWQQQRGRNAQLNYQASFGQKGTRNMQPAQHHPAYIAG